MRAVSKGELDGREGHALAIKASCHQLAGALGESWEDLSPQRRLLVEQASVKAVVLGIMAGYALARNVIGRKGVLQAPLTGHYLAWSNSLRLDLLALGLARVPKDATSDLDAIKRRYEEKP